MNLDPIIVAEAVSLAYTVQTAVENDCYGYVCVCVCVFEIN